MTGGVRNWIKVRFLTGFFVTVPAIATAWLLYVFWDKIDYFFPAVSLSPNGDFALKGDEWQQIPLNVEILKGATNEAIYADGRAVTVA